MADQKITELEAIDSLVSTDILPVVDSPGAGPETKKATLQQVSDFVRSTLYFDVSNYGTGTTDVEIQAAVDAAIAAGGGTVLIPKGTYTISTAITGVMSKVTLLGDGVGNTILQTVALGTNHIVDYRPAVYWGPFTIRGITFDGNDTGAGNAGLVSLASINDLLIEECEFKNSDIEGVFIGVGANRATIRNNIFHDNGQDGLTMWSSIYNSLVDGNKCYNNTQHGIWIATSATLPLVYYNEYNIVTNNICYNNSWAGIYMDSVNLRSQVTNNICQDNTLANIYIYGSDDVSVSGLTTDMLISGNICDGLASQAGMFCYKVGKNITITNNQVSNSGYSGIRVACDAANNNSGYLISGNLCYQNTGPGIDIYELDYPLVVGNQCYYNGMHGIFLNDLNVAPTITGNVCYENSQAGEDLYSGIYIKGSNVANAIISGNTSVGALQQYGIITTETNYLEVIGNNFGGHTGATSLVGANNDVAHNLG